MSVSRPWKDMERRVARLFGGVRVWRQDYGEVKPDGETEDLTWDTKCYERHAVISMFVEQEKKYREYTGSRQFLLVLFSRDRPRAGDFVLVPAKHYQELRERASLVHQFTAAFPLGDEDD